jgi:hypothetical protein
MWAEVPAAQLSAGNLELFARILSKSFNIGQQCLMGWCIVSWNTGTSSRPVVDCLMGSGLDSGSESREKEESEMSSIFYIIGVVVVVIFIAGYFGLT